MKQFKKQLKGKPNGKAKPIKAIEAPKMVRYSNRWYFANSARDPCDEVYEAGEAYRNRKIRKRFSHPSELTKFFYFLYLTGSRLREPVLGNLDIKIFNKSNAIYLTVSKINEKHEKNGKPDVIEMVLPIMCQAEANMWALITSNGTVTNAQQIFKFHEWGKLEEYRLSKFIKRNFKVDLKDENGTLHIKKGLTPHILRHMRAYDALVTHGVRKDIVMAWFGWDSENMLYYYAHIRQMLGVLNQLKVLTDQNIINGKFKFMPQIIEGSVNTD